MKTFPPRITEHTDSDSRELTSVLDLLPLAIALIDKRARLRYANPAWWLLTEGHIVKDPPGVPHPNGKHHYGPGDSIGALPLIGDVPELPRHLNSILNGESVELVWPVPFPLEARGRLLRMRAEPVGREGSADRGGMILLEEVDESKRFTQQIGRAQRMESVGALASALAHDFNNLLTAIIGSVHLAQNLQAEGKPIDRQLDTIEKTAMSAGDLAGKLLHLARGRTAAPRPIDINEVVRDACALLERVLNENITLEHQGEEIWTGWADPSQMQHVLVNLCINAQEAIEGHGRIVLATRNITATRGDAHPAELAPGTWVELSVTDNGCGIPPEEIGRVFDPFYTTKEKGTGLGLSTVYSLVHEQEGAVTLESEPGRGTTIRIYLKALPEEPLPVSSGTRDQQSHPSGTETILLVDDESMILDVVRELLAMHGYRVLTAAGGQEAVDLYDRETAEGRPIPLVILDMAMPGMNGLEAIGLLRRRDPAVRVILSSGLHVGDEMREALRDEVDAFVNKPFEAGRLARTVRELLDRSTPALSADR